MGVSSPLENDSYLAAWDKIPSVKIGCEPPNKVRGLTILTLYSIVEGSNTAVNALQNSPLVTLVTKSTGSYGEYFYIGNCFILGFSQKWDSISSYTNTYGDFIVGSSQKTVPATNLRQFDRINKFATGARVVAASWGGNYTYWSEGNVCGVKLIKLA